MESAGFDIPYGYEMLLIIGGLLAGMVNTIAGSGTLFTLGVMSLANIPLNIANIATRPGVFAQNVTGILTLKRYNQFERQDIHLGPIIATLVGAILGGIGATLVSARSFDFIASLVMFFLLISYLVPKRISLSYSNQAERPLIRYSLFFFAGIYGGFIQIGIGILLLTLLVGYLKMEYGKANALKLIIVLIYTIPTTLYFIYTDTILWKPALLLAAGQIVGAYLAAMFLSFGKQAEVWARWITIVMIIVTLTKIWLF